MSFNVTTHFVQQYTTNVQLLLQQKGSKLRDTVTVGSYTGKAAKAIEQVGSVDAQKRTVRHGDTPLISTPADARWVFPVDYEWADLIDDQDKLRMLIDPQSSYAINGAYALGRAMDDEIIASFFGTSKTGENGSTNTSFPAGQQVAATVGSTGATGMNISKLREAKRILMANEVDIDNDPLFCVISAQQHDDLLNEAQAISLDYNTRPVLVDGKITSFMGFNFIHSERLDVDGSSYRRVAAFAKSGMHLGMWNDISTMISERADKGYATQVYVKGTFGATRTEEKKVVEIKCSE
jgi:subtilisin family serine protease